MSGAAYGALLGCANAVLIAVGICLENHGVRFGDQVLGVGGLSIIICLPAVIAGALLGVVADKLTDAEVWLQRVVLGWPALWVVGIVGTATGLDEFVVVSYIPTCVATVLLERYTRASASVPTALASNPR